MKSFAILRTNVGLTTNVKIMVDSNYGLSLNSIDSNYLLSSDRFKKFIFNKNNYYDDILPNFYEEVPVDLSYQIKYNNDVDTMSTDFSNQYDELYNYGARNIIDNKNYDEEYEYFAPLYIKPNNLPSNFIIFRVDGPGIESINKENFESSILNRLKTVKVFDLGIESKLGQWLDRNFISNSYFPDAPLEIDFRNLEFSKWNGIDYQNGGYTSKSSFLEEIFEKEKEIFELEKFIFDNYKNNKIVFPNILNISFLFDDTVSTPDIKRSWSLNRYFGFYINEMERETTMSPYKPVTLRSDVEILEGNLLFSPSNINNPFSEEWTEDKPFYVEYKGEYFLVKRYNENRGEEIGQVKDDGFINEEYKNVIFLNYKIISDLDLEGEELLLNKNYGYIDSNGNLKKDQNTYFTISNFDDASVWLINIDGIYHNIVKDENNNLKINSDYSFNFTKNYYEYKVRSESKRVSFLVDYNNIPNKFEIFKLNFTDIKDFDTKIVDTDYSRYEYEKETDLTNTDEPKMYFENPLSNTNPKEIDDYELNNEVINVPVSSEYTANYETFKIENDDLSDIWRINPVYCRWGLQGSLAFQDKPYLLNNSFLFEDYNKCVNPFESNPIRSERNLDYFYTINSSTASYLNHSLHIEKLDTNGDIDINFNFELSKYFNQNYNGDYFTFFFERPMYFNNSKIKNNVRKHSFFNKGDSSIPNITVFKGLEFKLFNVNSFTLNSSNQIENINVSNSNEFEDYKFSILLTEKSNGMNWKIIESWEIDKSYQSGDIVVFDDILYIAINDNVTTSPTSLTTHVVPSVVNSAPYTSSDWVLYNNQYSIIWNPNRSLNIAGSYIDSSSGTASVIYNDDKYYYCESANSNEDIWNPYRMYNSNYTPYGVGDVTLYKGQYYISMTSSNRIIPGTDIDKLSKTKSYNYWSPTQSVNPKWKEIEIWNPSKSYTGGNNNDTFVVHEETVYRASVNESFIEIGEEPGISILWNRVYSHEPDADYIYNVNDNPIIIMNNRYYLLTSNPNSSKLDNGINIYINKKWKNVLVEIYFNDSTLPNIRNKDRDDIYTDVHSILTAYNFIRSVNDISNKAGFINYLNYVVINEDGSINYYNYNDNIKNLPYIISCETPESLLVKVDSLNKKPISVNLNPLIRLKNGKIDKLSKLNWSNNIPIAYTITENREIPKIFKNYNRISNIEYLQIQRFNGYYMPIFVDIHLFNKDSENKKEGNYLFDLELFYFGIIKERKIRKINRKESILKFKNSKTEKSIYPMVDEYGYSFNDFMIFKSTWDLEYHIETVQNKQRFIKKADRSINLPKTIGQPVFIQIENNKRYTL